MRTDRVLVNARAAVLQIVVSSILLLLLYKYLLQWMGIAQLGIWSVMLAISSIVRVGDLGFSSSIVRNVARFRAEGQEPASAGAIQTAVISVAATQGVVAVLLMPVSSWLLPFVLQSADLEMGLRILPVTLAILLMNGLSGVISASLDGCRRSDLRSYGKIAGSVCLVTFALVLVPRYGLHGLLLAQIAESILVIAISWKFLRRIIMDLPVIPSKWSMVRFVEMMRFGTRAQLIALLLLLMDPVTKSLIGRFGGLVTAGYYEMASRLVLQFRNVLVAANQVLIPEIAALRAAGDDSAINLYKNAFQFIYVLALPLLLGVAASAPLISILWIGRFELIFVILVTILSIAWLFSTLCVPAFFYGFGSGSMRGNIEGHFLMGVLNVILGGLLGWKFGGSGVAAGTAIAIVSGSYLLIARHHKAMGIRLGMLLGKDDIVLGILCVAGIVAAAFSFHMFSAELAVVYPALLSMLLFGLFSGAGIVRHGRRNQIWRIAWRTLSLRRAPF